MIRPQTTQPGSQTAPRGGPGTAGRRGRSERGMSLIELLVVIVIIGLIASIVVVGIDALRKKMKITSTRATLDLLETIVDEYNVQTDGYFSATALAQDLVVPPAAGFLETVEGVGEIFKLTGALPKNKAGTVVVDAWNRPIHFYSPGASDRPLFWSDGRPDDLLDTSPARPWETNHAYVVNDLVGYKSRVYECRAAHTSDANTAPTEQGTAQWELTDGIGTFK